LRQYESSPKMTNIAGKAKTGTFLYRRRLQGSFFLGISQAFLGNGWYSLASGFLPLPWLFFGIPWYEGFSFMYITYSTSDFLSSIFLWSVFLGIGIAFPMVFLTIYLSLDFQQFLFQCNFSECPFPWKYTNLFNLFSTQKYPLHKNQTIIFLLVL